MLYLHHVFNGIWMIDSDYATNFLPLVTNYIKGDIKEKPATKENELTISFATRQSDKFTVTPYGYYSAPEAAPEDSVAIIHINGAITKHDQWCGPDGMLAYASLMDRCYANDNITGIILSMESGGGEAYAMRVMNDAIARRNKPVVGFVDDFAASAAYGIISGCDHIVANSPQAMVGSIGAYQTIADYTEYFKLQGINLIEIYATQSKDKNQDFHEAIKGNLEPLRKKIDVFNESFLSMVETNRSGKISGERKEWGTGKMFFAEEAIAIGLIDEINSLENVLNYF